MSSVVDVSSKLGEYMLKGWVLTDKSCPTAGCRVPLMRSPDGLDPVVWFCANCDGSPYQSTSSASDAPSNEPSSPSRFSNTHYSHASTAPTEVSSALSSPTFAPPAETEESLRRRRQSDAASAEIGKRLLKGWAMLADECPNSGCYGIPLVRPPKAGGEKNPQKECVVCGNVYIDEKDGRGFDRLVSLNDARPPSDDTRLEPNAVSSESGSWTKGKTVARDETPIAGSSALPFINLPSPARIRLAVTPGDNPHAISTSIAAQNSEFGSKSDTIRHTLEISERSLESTLSALSHRLTALSGQSILDPSSISQTAEAMSRVAQALSHVIQLQRESLTFP